MKGIYYLLNDEEIVYIGKSLSSMKKRIINHIDSGEKIFTKVRYHEIENEQDIHLLEVAMISKYKPKYNKDCISNHGSTIELDIKQFLKNIVEENIFYPNTQGMKNMKYNDLSKVGESVINSNLDARLFFFIIKHQGPNSMLRKSYGKDLATTTYLAKKFNVTPQKVRKFIRDCIELNLLKKIKKNFIINPYMVSPFGSTNNQLHRLQLWWDEDPDYIIEFEEEINLDEFQEESIVKFHSELVKKDS